MKILIASALFINSLTALSSFAAPSVAPTGSTGLCKDGTYYSGANKRGACRGHKGVQEWYATTNSAPTSPNLNSGSSPTANAVPAVPMAPSIPPTKSTLLRGPGPVIPSRSGGGSDKVWANLSTGVYHCPGTRFYGTTKKGEYMTEAEAKNKSLRPDHGKPCS